jgi:hypothetical protein
MKIGPKFIQNLRVKIYPKSFRPNCSFVKSIPGQPGVEVGDLEVHSAFAEQVSPLFLPENEQQIGFKKYFLGPRFNVMITIFGNFRQKIRVFLGKKCYDT